LSRAADRAYYVPNEDLPSPEMKLSVRLDKESIEAMAVEETLEFPIAPIFLPSKNRIISATAKMGISAATSELLLQR
jgi:hypothetical protein